MLYRSEKRDSSIHCALLTLQVFRNVLGFLYSACLPIFGISLSSLPKSAALLPRGHPKYSQPLENMTKRINVVPYNVKIHVVKSKSFKSVIRPQPLEKIQRLINVGLYLFRTLEYIVFKQYLLIKMVYNGTVLEQYFTDFCYLLKYYQSLYSPSQGAFKMCIG